MSNFDRHAFTSALESAALNVPRKGLMDKVIFELMHYGYGAANVADGWRKINLPEETLVIQLELGEAIQPDLLSCVVLNALVPEGKYFPLIEDSYDQITIALDEVSVQEACVQIDDFYRKALNESKALV